MFLRIASVLFLLAFPLHAGSAGPSAEYVYDPDTENGWKSTNKAGYQFTDHGAELVLCYQWNCNNTIRYDWDLQVLDKVSRQIERCSTSAENELLALRNAVRDTERAVLKKFRFFAGDVAGNHMDRLNLGRLDCVDNSGNTNAILRALQEHNRFRYWRVHKRQHDGLFKPHLSAAVITTDQQFIDKYRPETRMGKKDYTVWVIDSWLTTFAHKPFLIERNDWKHKLDPWGNGPYLKLYRKKLRCWK